MKLALAPMEGVLDHPMRELLCELGGFDYCVTEFVRVTNQLLPPRVFHRLCPELKQGGKTRNGTPVVVQLLGGNATMLAANAARASELGAPGIDLNFGCPAKTVNRHDGGAALLKSPERLYNIVSEVRQSVPDIIPVTAKMRLGFEDKSLALENASAIEAGGAAHITVHARTKVEGYAPPAHWQWLHKIQRQVSIPVIANGEVWNVSDYKQCRNISQCEDVMVGRGAIRTPDIGLQIKAANNGHPHTPLNWLDVCRLLQGFYHQIEHIPARFACSRLKQWVGLLSNGYPEGKDLFNRIKRLKEIDLILNEINSELLTEGRH